MSSSGLSEKKLEKKLRLVGYKLEKPASSTEELVSHLENAEKLLPFVRQRPQRSMEKAMLPLMTALIMDAILKHPDPNVQVTVASCHSELVRITAPEFTYEDEHMKYLFRLFLVAFNYLSCGEGINFERAVRILEIMAKARSCLMMMDMEIDHMIVEMFQLFLNIIRPNHSADIFKYMKTIMVMIIEESDEISVELLTPLLASVKMDNNSSSLRSWELGNSVFESCAIKLQDSVRKTVKEMNLNVSDYAEIVASLNQDIPTGEAMV